MDEEAIAHLRFRILQLADSRVENTPLEIIARCKVYDGYVFGPVPSPKESK